MRGSSGPESLVRSKGSKDRGPWRRRPLKSRPQPRGLRRRSLQPSGAGVFPSRVPHPLRRLSHGAENQSGRIWSGLLFPSWRGWGGERTEENQLCAPNPPLQLERAGSGKGGWEWGREKGRSSVREGGRPASHPRYCLSACFSFVTDNGPSVGALAEDELFLSMTSLHPAQNSSASI